MHVARLRQAQFGRGNANTTRYLCHRLSSVIERAHRLEDPRVITGSDLDHQPRMAGWLFMFCADLLSKPPANRLVALSHKLGFKGVRPGADP